MPSNTVFVFSEKADLLNELAAGARTLVDGAQVTALALGSRDQAAQTAADRVMWLGDVTQDRLVEDYVPTIAGLLERERPALVLFGATRRGRVVAGRVAAKLGMTVLTDVTAFEGAGASITITHLIFGGGAVRTEKPLSEMVIATVGQGTFSAGGAAGAAQVEDVPFVDPPWKATLRERRQRQAATVNLNMAKKVVCPGRGVARQDDLRMIEDLARLLGAEIACTRPLAEGLGWLPRERYIGISGASIRPDLYLGVGVSGQVQHAIGMSRSKVVVAINKDENAPIFSQADYGIVGDLYAVVPALIDALKNRG